MMNKNKLTPEPDRNISSVNQEDVKKDNFGFMNKVIWRVPEVNMTLVCASYCVLNCNKIEVHHRKT